MSVLVGILIVLSFLTGPGRQTQRSAAPDVKVLFQQLQEPNTTNEATAKLAELARENRSAREYLAVHLPPLIENLPALEASMAQGTVRADVAGNVVHLAADLKLKEAVPALVKVLPKDEPGGAVSMGSTERLDNDPLGKALAKIGDASVIPVSHLLEDPDRDTRWRAARILLNIRSPAARRALRSHIPKEQDPNFRERLIHDVGDLSSLAVYDPDPNHLWNRLFRQFYVRKAWDGNEYGGDVLDPLLWGETHYLISGPLHEQALKVLDEFLTTHGEQLITDPLKRSMLQRDLWAVFEWVTDPFYAGDSKLNRTQLARKLVQVIQRLALTPEQIEALPDTYSLAVAAKAFPAEYNSSQRETPFLPPDLFQSGSGWVNLGASADASPLGAPVHTHEFGARSLFLLFIRLPGGRDATLAYITQLADFPKPCIQAPGQPTDQPYFLTRDRFGGTGVGAGGMVPNPDLPQFPRGTQVVLLRRMMLIDREGQLKPTRLVESVQIRVFVDIPSRAEWLSAPSKPLQDVFELRVSRRRLFAGGPGGLRAVARDEWEFPTFMVHPFDALEGGPGANASMGTLFDAEHRRAAILNTCVGCHGAPGVQSLAATRRLFGQGDCTGLKFYATSEEEQAEEAIDWKHRQYNWGLLQGLWPSNAD